MSNHHFNVKWLENPSGSFDFAIKKSHVLVVEDNESQRKILEIILKKANFDVQAFECGEDALEWLKIPENFDQCDVILLDIMMPRMDGVEILKRLSLDSRYKIIPIIMLTALDEPSKISECLLEGAADYVSKPYRPEELLARISAHVRIRNLQRELQKATMHKTQNAIAYGMADTLNNRMTGVIGYLDIMFDTISSTPPYIEDPDEFFMYQDRFLKSWTRLKSAVDDFVEYTRGLGQYTISPVGIQRLIEELSISNEEDVDFEISGCIDKLPKVAADQAKLTQCFQEIINNAIEAAKGKVSIKVDAVIKEPFLTISFTDNACGIQRELIDIVSLPFFTTKGTNSKGLVGLWSTQQYLRSIGGELTLASQQDIGTTVTMTVLIYRENDDEI